MAISNSADLPALVLVIRPVTVKTTGPVGLERLPAPAMPGANAIKHTINDIKSA